MGRMEKTSGDTLSAETDPSLLKEGNNPITPELFSPRFA